MSAPMPGTEAIIQRYRPVGGGYLMAVRVAADIAVTDWYAEVVLPDGAEARAGADTRIEQRPLSVKVMPIDGHLTPGPGDRGYGAVKLAVGATSAAPTRLRVKVNGAATGGFAPVKGVYVTSRNGTLVPATEAAWPGSTHINTDPDGWEHSGGGGFGGGGGGGGGGQSELMVTVDERGILREIRHKTDGGGGGGAGGGGGWGEAGAGYAESGQQQGQHEQHQQQGGQSGNPMTQLQASVDALTKRIEAIERKVR